MCCPIASTRQIGKRLGKLKGMGPIVGPIRSVDPICEDLILLSVDYLLNRRVVASSLYALDVKSL